MIAVLGTLGRSALGEMLRPFCITLGVGLLIVWISQALRLLQYVLSNADAFGSYVYMTLLSLGSALTSVLPLCALAAAIYIFVERHNSGAAVVAASSGVTALQSSAPVLLFGFITCMAVAVNALFIAPMTEREMRNVGHQINADFVSAILMEGRFNFAKPEVMFFIGGKNPNGTLSDLVISDNRSADFRRTYVSREGYVIKRDNGDTVLVMRDGKLLNQDKRDLRARVLTFRNYSTELSEFSPEGPGGIFRTRNLTTAELIEPPNNWWRSAEMANKRKHELYRRLSAGLYAVGLSAIACLVFARTTSGRTPVSGRVSLAILLGVIFHLSGEAVGDYVRQTASDYFIMILFPFSVSLLCILVLAYKSIPLPRMPRVNEARHIRHVAVAAVTQ